MRQRPRDAHHLALGHRQAGEGEARIETLAQAVEQRGRFAPRPRTVDEQPQATARFATDENVLLSVQMRKRR